MSGGKVCVAVKKALWAILVKAQDTGKELDLLETD
jgi:hypothetical protein